jgi:hypothetical protein
MVIYGCQARIASRLRRLLHIQSSETNFSVIPNERSQNSILTKGIFRLLELWDSHVITEVQDIVARMRNLTQPPVMHNKIYVIALSRQGNECEDVQRCNNIQSNSKGTALPVICSLSNHINTIVLRRPRFAEGHRTKFKFNRLRCGVGRVPCRDQGLRSL